LDCERALRAITRTSTSASSLAALVAFSPYLAAPPVRAMVGVYAFYDPVAQWSADQTRLPRESIVPVEKMVGAGPYEAVGVYTAASATSHVAARTRPPFVMLIWGEDDEIVLPDSPSIWRRL
jgi:hypothetical protein